MGEHSVWEHWFYITQKEEEDGCTLSEECAKFKLPLP